MLENQNQTGYLKSSTWNESNIKIALPKPSTLNNTDDFHLPTRLHAELRDTLQSFECFDIFNLRRETTGSEAISFPNAISQNRAISLW